MSLKSNNNKEISKWNNEEVLIFLKDLNLTNYSEIFQNNMLTGYDLCTISNEELKNDLKMTKYHDRTLLSKSIKEVLLEQFKLNLRYEDKSFEVQLDLEKKTTVESLFPLIKDVFRLMDNRVFVLSNNGEILSKNCNLCELILLNSAKYKNIIISTEPKKSYNQSEYSSPQNNTIDTLKKTNSQTNNFTPLNNYIDPIQENKYKKYNEITGLNKNNTNDKQNFDSITNNTTKDFNSKYDLKYGNKQLNENFSTLPQTSSKLNKSIENKNADKYENKAIYNDKYSPNSYNINNNKDPMAITDDYKMDNSLEIDRNALKKYDNSGYGGFKSKLDKNYNNEIKNDLSDPLEKDSFYDKDFNSFNNNKLKNYNLNDELITPKDSNINNPMKYDKYETNSQKHSPMRNNNENNKFSGDKFDYLGGDTRDSLASNKNAKNRYCSSEKRVFRNEKDKEKYDKYESKQMLNVDNNQGGLNTNLSNNADEKDYFKGLNNNNIQPKSQLSGKLPSNYEENNSYTKSQIPSDLKYKIDSMRTEFNDNIKRFQDPNVSNKKGLENNIPMKQNVSSNQNSNLPTDKKLARNNFGTDKKK